ncbi:unnamed protein product [Bursaphelenchus xylophilus]|uniref:(pine wood nematode) hypothetical protein n=1 Tax=Bursaphelenchus xylophilus TaxID=6326 RepID=A0A1I7SDB5_BURXY|nr:unnamed protein product [Bursaphelenchus xylophilus]CAG9130581.1 unnamed protein product [Bursaphelenchus xylophilus]
MQKVEVRTVSDVFNALTFNVNGTLAFLYDRSTKNIVAIDLISREKVVLKWPNNYFRKSRWTCYHLSYIHSQEQPKLIVLWYNGDKKRFCLSSHVIKDNALSTEQIRHYFPLEITYEVGYWVQINETNFYNIIFYTLNDETNKFWHFEYSVTSNCVKEVLQDSLPIHSKPWELPTLTSQGLLFISHERNSHLALFNKEKKIWTKAPIGPDKELGRGPSANGIWGQLHHPKGIILCGQRVKRHEYISEIWLLDTQLAEWKLISAYNGLPRDSINLALRMLDNTHIYYHIDSESLGPSLFQIQNAISKLDPQLSPIPEENDDYDIVCSICLDTYEEPKLLGCGHSFCKKCLASLPPEGIENGIKCPVCRILTPCGINNLNINYGLREAVEVLDKVKRSRENGFICEICQSPTSENNIFLCLECRNQKFCSVCVLFNHQDHKRIELKKILRDQKEVNKIKKEFNESLETLKSRLISDISEAISTKLCNPLIESEILDFENWISNHQSEYVNKVKEESEERRGCVDAGGPLIIVRGQWPTPLRHSSASDVMGSMMCIWLISALLFPLLGSSLNPSFAAQPVRCYDCRADDNTCNVGECQGVVCIKMETSNMDNDRKTVHKTCSDEYEPTQCKQSGFGSKLITRCTCEGNFCNGDDNLNAAGLQPATSATQKVFPVVLIAMFFTLITSINRS